MSGYTTKEYTVLITLNQVNGDCLKMWIAHPSDKDITEEQVRDTVMRHLTIEYQELKKPPLNTLKHK